MTNTFQKARSTDTQIQNRWEYGCNYTLRNSNLAVQTLQHAVLTFNIAPSPLSLILQKSGYIYLSQACNFFSVWTIFLATFIFPLSGECSDIYKASFHTYFPSRWNRRKCFNITSSCGNMKIRCTPSQEPSRHVIVEGVEKWVSPGQAGGFRALQHDVY